MRHEAINLNCEINVNHAYVLAKVLTVIHSDVLNADSFFFSFWGALA